MEPGERYRERLIRVFISSTFRDMQAERDYLVKFIFPQLRKLCASRSVTWGEVDLRWGVTDEAAAEGQVLPICLEEIRRCRPYFIGLLGERYGWIPDVIPSEVIEREPWLQEHVYGRKSVTELEILHGVLNNPQMAEHTFFYLRDPKYIESVPLEKRADFATENAESREKLQQLKDRIRRIGLPVRENYHDPKALGELVLQDLTAVVDRLFPEGLQPDPLEAEAAAHELCARQLRLLYIPSPQGFTELDNLVDRADRPVVIAGETGSGKSAFLANWVAERRKRDPEALTSLYLVGTSEFSTDWAVVARLFLHELQKQLEIGERVPTERDRLPGLVSDWLRKMPTRQKAILVIDGIEKLEKEDAETPLEWLPSPLPANLRLIVSTSSLPLSDALASRGWTLLPLPPLDHPQCQRLVHEILRSYSKSLPLPVVERLASSRACANPLFLTTLLDELRLFGIHERLASHVDSLLHARTIVELYVMILRRWEHDYEQVRPGLVRESMACLWACRRGMNEAELRDILGENKDLLPQRIWSPFVLAAERALIRQGGRLALANQAIAAAVEQRFLPDDSLRRQVHRELADYFLSVRGPGERQYAEVPYHLIRSNTWDRLGRFVTNRDNFIALFRNHRKDLMEYLSLLSGQIDIAFRFQESVEAWKQGGAPPDYHKVEVLSGIARCLLEIGNNEACLLFVGKTREVIQQMDAGARSRVAGYFEWIDTIAAAAQRERTPIESDWQDLERLAEALGAEHPEVCKPAERLFFKAGRQNRLDIANEVLRRYLAWMLFRDVKNLDSTQIEVAGDLRKMIRVTEPEQGP